MGLFRQSRVEDILKPTRPKPSKNKMSATEVCPQCQQPLPANAPGGICPACLLQAGLEPVTGANVGHSTAETSGYRGFSVPSIESMNAQIPQLEFIELLGQGGMGAVFKARQPELDRFVAVKILPKEIGADAKFTERFSREAKALAKLSHQNIVTVYDFGQLENQYYFVMEYVDGTDLRQLIDGGQVTAEQSLEIVRQICEALQFAHANGVVHRDIKPENVLIDKTGRVQIADFGLAKLLDSESVDVSLTGTRQVMGTLRYMAPEQTRGTKAVDHRADIFSLGVIFYELLTGDLPIGRFHPPSRKASTDARLDDVVLKALENEPADRYQSASDVNLDLDSIANSSISDWPNVPGDGVGAGHSPYPAQPTPGLAAPITPTAPVKQVAPLFEPTELPTLNKKAVWGAWWFLAFLIGAGLLVFQAATVQSNNPSNGSSGVTGVGSPIWYSVGLVLIVAVPVALAALVGTPWLGVKALGEIRRSKGAQFGLRLAMFDILVFPVLFITFVICVGASMGVIECLFIFGLLLAISVQVGSNLVKRKGGFQKKPVSSRQRSKGLSKIRLIVLLVCVNVAVMVFAFVLAPVTDGSFAWTTQFEKVVKSVWYFRQTALWISFASIVLSGGVYFFLTSEQ